MFITSNIAYVYDRYKPGIEPPPSFPQQSGQTAAKTTETLLAYLNHEIYLTAILRQIVHRLKLVCQVAHKVLRIRLLAGHALNQFFRLVDRAEDIHLFS